MSRDQDIIQVKSNVRDLVRELERLHRDQIPFAVARTLTKTALSARQEVIQRFPKDLESRSRSFPRVVVGTKPAKKADFPRTTSQVGIRHRYGWMADHVTGKRRSIPGKSQLIPNPKRIKRTTSGRIPPRVMPRPLVDEGIAVIARRKGNRSYVRPKPIIRKAAKISRSIRGGVRKSKEYLFNLRPSVRIKATWPFERRVLDAAERWIGRHYAKSMIRAVRTARR